MIVTVTLARSAMQLATRKVIVKRLSSIHDLGAMDVLCTDKTGTLTEATIALVRVIDGAGSDSERALRYAYINSRFESGMETRSTTPSWPFARSKSRHGKSWTRFRSISNGGGCPSSPPINPVEP